MRLLSLPAALAASLFLTACAATDTARPPAGEEGRMIKLAQDLQARGETETAVGLLEQASKLAGDSPAAQLRLGQGLLDANQPERAATAFRAALNADPDNGPALLGLGTAQLRADQVEGAARTLAVAAPKVRTSAAYNRLGTALILSGGADQAEAAFRQAARIEPANLDTQSNIALAQALTGQADAGAATARGVVASPRSERRHYRNLMLILTLAGKEDKARAVRVPDESDTDRAAFIAEARKIRAIASPAGKARAIGLLAGG